MNRKIKVGIVGFGHMGQALGLSLVNNKRFEILAYDINLHKKKILDKINKVRSVTKIQTLLQSSDIVILAIKPQNFSSFFKVNQSYFLHANPLVVSIAAGITLKKLQAYLPKAHIVRVMPNLALSVKKSISFICGGRYSTKRDLLLVETIFSDLGKTIFAKESLFDKITSISGSGPGYVFYFMDSIYKTALDLGFSQKIAKEMIMQIFDGAVMLAKNSGKDFTVLVQEVASKGGMTESALRVFKRHKIKETIAKGVNKACKRAKDISNKYK